MSCEFCQSELPAGALFCGECGNAVSRKPLAPAPLETPPPAAEHFAPVATGEPETTSTKIVPRVEGVNLSELFESSPQEPAPTPRFATEKELSSVLSFTITLGSGESVELTRSGLLGRMPAPTDGEEFEHLIVVTDPGRSVSKTHLELGVENDELWVADRNSGNGSIIREPGVVPRRAQPGTRYPVVRGTRIDIGDLHLTIS
ncbi:hypothetical protein M2119_000854 [Aurantimicrobium minutum]|uniref:FHA domain-containing protein n=1 Tax=Aurantimicrobium minutum TaxID=708131 RepID=UPI002475B36D|nr:FHA domain-containing protein [Aurantimicrobium minutum]MDH6532617.1 hypothetical protein [Aurantimicrobium minutum]